MTTRVVVTRNRVQEGWRVHSKLLLQRVYAQTIFICRNTDDVEAVIPKDLKRQKKAGFFNKNGGAGPGKNCGYQIETESLPANLKNAGRPAIHRS